MLVRAHRVVPTIRSRTGQQFVISHKRLHCCVSMELSTHLPLPYLNQEEKLPLQTVSSIMCFLKVT